MEWKKLLSIETQVEREEEPEVFKKYPVGDLEKDYKSIITSAAFRRLQDKTQVFPLDKSDFVRTRLTHSIEVSTIARQLGIMVTKNKSSYLPEEFKKGGELVERIPSILSCAGLLHDIGNPPFGHFGEVIIGEWFKNEFVKETFTYKGKKIEAMLDGQMKSDLENFEGNAQALRILSKIKNKHEGYDANLTYGVLCTLIKYPTSSNEFDGNSDDLKKHKLGYYCAENETMRVICDNTGTRLENEYIRHPLVFLLEAADDIAYSTADLEDALKKRLFSIDEFVEFYEKKADKITNISQKRYSCELLEDLKGRLKVNNRSTEADMAAFQKWMEYVKKWLMYAAAFRFSKSYKDIMEGKYKYDLFYDTNHQETIKILKKSMIEFVFDSREILKLELSAKRIISSLLDDFVYAVLYWEDGHSNEEKVYTPNKADKKLINIISTNYKEDYLQAKSDDDAKNLYLRLLMVTDFISGMTDSYAKNIYQEINGLTK